MTTETGRTVDLTTGYKALTHDLRPPLRGGEPVFDGHLPSMLPAVTMDDGPDECAAGWNYTATIDDALAIAGLWPDGRPSRVFVVTDACAAIARGNKRRCVTATLTAEVGTDEIDAAIQRLSDRWFGPAHAAVMAAEQSLWRQALARPHRNSAAVEAGLRRALEIRSLDWSLQRYDTARAAEAAARAAAWAAGDARDARAAWAAWDAWDARAARAAGDARDARAAWAAWDARDARAAGDARDARDALVVHYAARCGWVNQSAELLTAGLRDAYGNGLAVAVPTSPSQLGWAMETQA